MRIDPKKPHFEVVKEGFYESHNQLTRYQFIDETTAMHFYVKLHSKYERQSDEERARWCCRLDLWCKDGFLTISCFGYGILTWNSDKNPIFEEMLQKYCEKKKEG